MHIRLLWSIAESRSDEIIITRLVTRFTVGFVNAMLENGSMVNMCGHEP